MRTHVSERKFEMSPTGVSFDSATMGCVQCKEMTQKKKLRRYGMTLSCSPFVANSFRISWPLGPYGWFWCFLAVFLITKEKRSLGIRLKKVKWNQHSHGYFSFVFRSQWTLLFCRWNFVTWKHKCEVKKASNLSWNVWFSCTSFETTFNLCTTWNFMLMRRHFRTKKS